MRLKRLAYAQLARPLPLLRRIPPAQSDRYQSTLARETIGRGTTDEQQLPR